MKGIGLERDGELVTVVMFEGWSGPNIWIHVANTPGMVFASRTFLAVVFDYPFNQLDVRRLSAYTEEANVAVQQLVRSLGFVPEARLVGVARDGGDAIIHRMWRHECRYLPRRA